MHAVLTNDRGGLWTIASVLVLAALGAFVWAMDQRLVSASGLIWVIVLVTIGVMAAVFSAMSR
ncbi:MAG: hypothetical protein ACT4PT_09230 [Methanobacteriota archaeon]